VNLKKPLLIIFVVLVVDQLLKFWIKTNMYLGQEYQIADWFIIHFTENNGMAFGMEFGGGYGKLFLSIFRILAVSGIGYYLTVLVKQKAGTLLIISVALIFAGALGNIIDSVFYGMIFSDSDYRVAQLFPADGGYAGILHGKVVDMLYFPLAQGYMPDWVPFWGGDYFVFFRPVFNIADSAISIGVVLLIIFQSFGHHEKNKEPEVEVSTDEDQEVPAADT
jgi:signal peptidase II